MGKGATSLLRGLLSRRVNPVSYHAAVGSVALRLCVQWGRSGAGGQNVYTMQNSSSSVTLKRVTNDIFSPTCEETTFGHSLVKPFNLYFFFLNNAVLIMKSGIVPTLAKLLSFCLHILRKIYGRTSYSVRYPNRKAAPTRRTYNML